MADGIEPSAPGDPAKPGMPRWVMAFVIVGVSLVALVALKLAGVVGEGHGPGRHMGGRSGGITNNAGGPADGTDSTRSVELSALDTFSFQPSSVAVSPGETVTFAVTNAGKGVHEFTLGDPAMQSEHAQMMSHLPEGAAHDTRNSITLQPGETKRLTWRFAGAGTLEYACHVQDHYARGMRGRIDVT